MVVKLSIGYLSERILSAGVSKIRTGPTDQTWTNGLTKTLPFHIPQKFSVGSLDPKC